MLQTFTTRLSHALRTIELSALMAVGCISMAPTVQEMVSPDLELPVAEETLKAPTRNRGLGALEIHDSIELINVYAKAVHDGKKRKMDDGVIAIPNTQEYVIQGDPPAELNAGKKATFIPWTLVVPKLAKQPA